MENMILETTEKYQSFLKEIKKIALKGEIKVLAKDKTPDNKLLSFMNLSLKNPENNKN